jgi:hypothetical protein
VSTVVVEQPAPARRWGRWIAGGAVVVGGIAVVATGQAATVGGWLLGRTAGTALVRRLFLGGLGLTHLVAFASWWSQQSALVGQRGLQPAKDVAKIYEERLGRRRFWLAPSLFWLAPRDATLHALAATGTVAAVLLTLNVAPGVMLVVLYVAWLSTVNAGGAFLRYQWDALLAETTFAALLLAPWRLRPGPDPDIPRLALLALRLVVFRLMFLSGYVKLASGDRTWRGLTALTHHYQTQPLPNPVAWYAHGGPRAFHRFSTAITLGMELALPFVMWLGRPGRLVAGAGFAILLGMLQLTGNYGYFQLLSFVLCIPLLDDRLLAAAGVPRPASVTARLPALSAPLALASLLLGLVQLDVQLFQARHVPAFARKAYEKAAPFEIANAYGLFAVMTTSRPEIVIEGSRDGKIWEAYELPAKPGDLDRAPPVVAPHQPRLDWQLWFAALGPSREADWMVTLAQRLLEGEPAVRALFAKDPFGDDPPLMVRFVLYEYAFSGPSLEGFDEAGRWWQRKRIGVLLGPISLFARVSMNH